VIFFDAGVERFPTGPEPGILTVESRASAKAFLSQVRGGTGMCAGAALHSALDSARLSGARRNLIVYFSNAVGTCGGADEARYLETVLEDVSRANSGLARIYTFGALTPASVGETFLKNLAERNGGTFWNS
jgi:hypothetical protein